jgi:hypothetical protein
MVINDESLVYERYFVIDLNLLVRLEEMQKSKKTLIIHQIAPGM